MKVRSTKTFAEAIYESSKGKSGPALSEVFANVVDFMNKNQLLSKSKEIITELERIIDRDEGVLRAHITSASPLSKKSQEELESNLKKRYKAKEVELDITEDKKLIHGVKIQVEDEIIDLSTSHRLNQLQAHLIKN